ncbi:hypothetical protein TVAG_280810 [Trichomonas vaginalis G3]|uniref:Uncharacterized protein n=1 Tax=Trichomonas vaginalis (strain ATCC PRA-98 / G3) TaxID=412133 RepID=A2DRK2_TRIV3|nr:hypothetical protein TVAGG3_0697000 [Trichomonas vaginalis G3]EAY16965.1 hypothetical protein TVAG_280810 [Trichomonas vaginalis G3]KAI5508988.1 hypothetical protein TVAGG3_0697000 [Trichomonas vaginalis G3]|eukprot:XP_001329188.1 hypothetical protein [Trichomonas vaginalis G3]
MQYFNLITSISAKSICKSLAHSNPPPQFVITSELPTPAHFHWASEQISQKFGGKKTEYPLDVIVYELSLPQYKQFNKLYEFLTSGANKNEMKPNLLFNLYQTNRNLFTSLITIYTPLYKVFNQNDLLSLFPKTEISIFYFINKSYAEIQLKGHIPKVVTNNSHALLQSIIETKDDEFLSFFQHLLLSNDQDTAKKPLHMSFIGSKHIDDYLLKPNLKLIKNFDLTAALKFSEGHPQYLAIAYILEFDKISTNRQFIENSIDIIKKISDLPPSFKQFFKNVKNDLTILTNLSKMVGQKFSFDDLSKHSIPYICSSLMDGLNLDDFLFMENFESFTNGYAKMDFIFIVSFCLFYTILTDFDETKINYYISFFKDPALKSQIFTDIFSLLFLEDNYGGFILPVNKIFKLLQIMSQSKTYDEIDNYISQVLAKIKCYDANNITYNALLAPSESLVHPLLIQKKFDLAVETVGTNQKMLKFIDLVRGTVEFNSNLSKSLLFKFKENEAKFYLEMAMSTAIKEYSDVALTFSKDFDDFLKKKLSKFSSKEFSRDIELEVIHKNSTYLTAVRNLDNLLLSRDLIFEKLNSFENCKYLNNLVDFINMCINCGITTPLSMKNMNPMEKLDELISNGKFDIALEFSGVNRIDFFQYLFVKYRANENILKLISPLYPMASLTMALSSLTPDELKKYRNVVLPKNSSKIMKNFYENKINPISDQILSEKPYERKLKIKEFIDNDDVSLDDYLYSSDPQIIYEIIMEKIDSMDLKKLLFYLDFLDCFIISDKISHTKEMVTFLLKLKNPPHTIKESKQNISNRLSQLVSRKKYQAAKDLSTFTGDQQLFEDIMVDHVINILLSKHESEVALNYCDGFEEKILLAIPEDQYEKRFELMNLSEALKLSNQKEFTALSCYFSVPPRLRPNKPDVNLIIEHLCRENAMDILFELSQEYNLNISKISQIASKEAIDLVSSYGDSLSLPILTPMIDDVSQILKKYQKFVENFQVVANSFVPIALHISAFVVVDCMEHEAICERFIVLFLAFLRKILKSISPENKKDIDIVIEKTLKVKILASISFYVRYNFVYGIDIVGSDRKSDQIHEKLVSDDFHDLAKHFKQTSENSKFFFTMLKFTDYEKAKNEFDKFKKYVQKKEKFLQRLLWAMQSPLCLDEDYIRSPVVDIAPQSLYSSCKKFIATKTSAFCPSWANAASFYIDQIYGISSVIKFFCETGFYGRAIEILKSNSFDESMFIYGVLLPSLSFGKVDVMLEILKENDPYYELSSNALYASISMLSKNKVGLLRYQLDMIFDDYYDAIFAVEDIYSHEKRQDVRSQILSKCQRDFPHELVNFKIIDLQEEFVHLQRIHGIQYNPSIHLFGDGLPLAMECLFSKKLYEFACKVAIELKIDPTQTINRISKSMSLSKARSFVFNFGKYTLPNNTSVFEDWITVLLHSFNSNNKTKSFVFSIIDKEIKSSKFKCHLLIQFGYTSEAKSIAIRENLSEFIILLSD